MMADGALNADIARELVLSPATVKTHVNHIFTKLGAKDRVQAVLRYREATAAAPTSAPASTPRALQHGSKIQPWVDSRAQPAP